VRVAEPHQLLRAGERVHVQLGGRHVSLLNHRGTVHCIDSLCYHAAGAYTRSLQSST
jgi:nitrite reductase/ring-hydroxylating ferredoxin subunit